MEFKVSADIIKETTECKYNFSCLSGEKGCLCEVEKNFFDKILFVKPIENAFCDYKISFGYSYTCSCPVRMEIHNRYKV
jgi:hypothetical protein